MDLPLLTHAIDAEEPAKQLLMRNGKPVFRNGKPVFFIPGVPCVCCDFEDHYLECCDGKQIRELTLTLDGLEDWSCFICLWSTHEACAYLHPEDEFYEATPSNLNGTYTLVYDGSVFFINLGSPADADDPGVLMQTQSNASIGTSSTRHIYRIEVQWICSEIYGHLAVINYYVNSCAAGFGCVATMSFLGCAFGHLTCGDFSPLDFPDLVGIVEADSFEDVCDGLPMTGEVEASSEAPNPCVFDYTATASVTLTIP